MRYSPSWAERRRHFEAKELRSRTNSHECSPHRPRDLGLPLIAFDKSAEFVVVFLGPSLA